jgi:hypothetical protein
MNRQHTVSSPSEDALPPNRSPGTTEMFGVRNSAVYLVRRKGEFDPARTTREPVQYWRGRTWDAMTGEMIDPGQPRLHTLTREVEGKPHEAIRPEVEHMALASATSPVEMSAAETPNREKPRKRRNCTPKAETPPTPLEDRRWLTIKQTAQRYPYSEGALRHLVFQAEQYAKYPKSGLNSNGFLPCIVRPQGARRVLIDAAQFERWLQGQ